MVDSYNEDDDLQRLKVWWQENWLALVLGIGTGLGAIVAWQGWGSYVDHRAQAAADVYQALTAGVAGGDSVADVQALATELREDYAATPYATQAALLLAEHFVVSEQYSEAREQLQWVTSYGDQPGFRHIARVRQARLLWAQGQADEALVLLDHKHPEAYASLYAELAGDIHADTGDFGSARVAYQRALAHLPNDADPAVVRRKLADVAGAKADPTGEAA